MSSTHSSVFEHRARADGGAFLYALDIRARVRAHTDGTSTEEGRALWAQESRERKACLMRAGERRERSASLLFGKRGPRR
eukprot:scaffold325519_cov54-Tisochrysis_lutea.AAC.8